MTDKTEVESTEAPSPATEEAPSPARSRRRTSPAAASAPLEGGEYDEHFKQVYSALMALPESIIHALREAIPERPSDVEEIEEKAVEEAQDPTSPPKPGHQDGAESGKSAKAPWGHRWMGWSK